MQSAGNFLEGGGHSSGGEADAILAFTKHSKNKKEMYFVFCLLSGYEEATTIHTT